MNKNYQGKDPRLTTPKDGLGYISPTRARLKKEVRDNYSVKTLMLGSDAERKLVKIENAINKSKKRRAR